MSYCIVYDSGTKGKYPDKQHKRKAKGIWIVALLLVTIVLFAANTSVRNVIKSWLIPGDPAVTEAALISLSENIRTGMGVKESIATFCVEILDECTQQG